MPIKAHFSAGETEIRVQSLHQWDYGQQLEIESVDIQESIVEVHFACPGMSEAIIHSCTIVGGKGTVPIPDRCLEQINPITAWVYEIEKNNGVVIKCTTTKTITIPVIARTRPGRGEEIPESVVDSCTELIAEVNEVIDKLNTGDVIAKHAKTADSAGHATTAQTAQNARQADKATHATSAYTASTATSAGWAGTVNPELVFSDAGGLNAVQIDRPGVYYIIYKIFKGNVFHGKYSSVFAIDNISANIRGSGNYESIEFKVGESYDLSFFPYCVDGAIRMSVHYEPESAMALITHVYRIAWFAEADE